MYINFISFLFSIFLYRINSPIIIANNITLTTTGEGTASVSKTSSPKNQEIELTLNTTDFL